MVVVALGGRDRGVAEQVAHLGQRRTVLDQPRRGPVPQVVPPHVDPAEFLQYGRNRGRLSCRNGRKLVQSWVTGLSKSASVAVARLLRLLG